MLCRGALSLPGIKLSTFWDRITHYKREEWKYDPDKVDARLVQLVDEFTEYVKAEYGKKAFGVIHVAWEADGHTADSQHYAGLAVDLHFAGVSLLDQFLAATRFPFTGIGVYPYWNNPGLHLDCRVLTDTNMGARWWRDRDGQYKALDSKWFALMTTQGSKDIG